MDFFYPMLQNVSTPFLEVQTKGSSNFQVIQNLYDSKESFRLIEKQIVVVDLTKMYFSLRVG